MNAEERADLLRNARIARKEFGMERLFHGVVDAVVYIDELEAELEKLRPVAELAAKVAP